MSAYRDSAPHPPCPTCGNWCPRGFCSWHFIVTQLADPERREVLRTPYLPGPPPRQVSDAASVLVVVLCIMAAAAILVGLSRA